MDVYNEDQFVVFIVFSIWHLQNMTDRASS